MESGNKKGLKDEKKKPAFNLSASSLLGDALNTQSTKMDIGTLLQVKPAPVAEERPVAMEVVHEKAEAVKERVEERAEEKPKEEVKKSRASNSATGYDKFLSPPEKRAARRTSVYVSMETHEKLQYLLRKLGSKMGLAEYLENIITDHFDQYGGEMNKRIVEADKKELKF